MAKKIDVYEEVTNKVIDALANGTVPWQKPWVDRGVLPMNFVTKKPYRGINPFLLSMSAYSSPYWLTFRQAKAKGGKVKKGEKSTLVVFWSMFENKKHDPKDPKSREKIPFLRYYNVFNVEQCEGLKLPEAEEPEEFDPIQSAEDIVKAYEDAPKVIHGGDRASYSPPLDHVRLPEREQFKNAGLYYETLFHELAHSTGHESRLNRPELVQQTTFGDDDYSKEELTAEMTAAMLCALAGINGTEENTAAYIKGWIEALQNDKKLLVQAAGKAQKAADYIQGITFDQETK